VFMRAVNTRLRVRDIGLVPNIALSLDLTNGG
jgi:hypothetical protein